MQRGDDRSGGRWLECGRGVYTPQERERVRSHLVAAARADPRITGVALFGSAAVEGEDSWSDVDLAFGIRGAVELQPALADWTKRMYEEHGALHHFDVLSGSWVYRVFLLPSTLQVDLAFAPAADFRARAPTFRLLFGAAAEAQHRSPPPAEQLIGLAWLYALHARSSIARGRLWRAEYMVSGVRDHVLALACLRHGLPESQGRGMDRLPAEVTGPLQAAVVRQLDVQEVRRAFSAAIEGLVREVRVVDEAFAGRLDAALRELAATASPLP